MTKQVYDLEERTFYFAKRVRLYSRKLPKNIANIEDSKQVVRASGSVGANYIEANETSMATIASKENVNKQPCEFHLANILNVFLLMNL